PYHYDRTSKPKLSHYLVTEIVAYGETCVPPDLPALGLQHRCELQRQRSICFGVADKDICHGRAHGPENPHASKTRYLASCAEASQTIPFSRRRSLWQG